EARQTEDALRLLASLRDLDACALAALLVARGLPMRGVPQLIDGVELLLRPERVDAALARLGWRMCRLLDEGDPLALEQARRLGLAATGDPSGRLEPLLVVQERLARLRLPLPQAQGPAPAESGERAVVAGGLAADLLELLDAEPFPVRANRAEAPPGVGEMRRAAGGLASSAEELTALAALMHRSGLLGVVKDGSGLRRAPTAAGRSFPDSETPERWRVLAEAWLAALPLPREGAGLLDEPAVRRSAALLGIADPDGRPGPIGLELLREGAEPATESLRRHLPEPADGVYVLPDLSIVAPGPLRAAEEAQLRLLARVERRGMAATLRIDPARIERSLNAGGGQAPLRETLDRISLNGVPQPVDYLLATAARRHGRVRVRSRAVGESGALVRALESTDGERLAVDRTLSPLALRRGTDGSFTTPVDPRTALAALLAAGYPAAAEAPDGRLCEETAPTAAPPRTEAPPKAAVELAEHWLAETRDDGQGGRHLLLRRRLELARRAKRPVRLRIALPGGAVRELELVPTSVLPARMRGRDTSADVERTLPLDAVVEAWETQAPA
ncbi:MAG: helicase-associated domain-containing protein, partial [Pseudoclavibacter sp.]|nr:helicase-associated domain-containing protein [Pseudoclavibacter sp.]